MRCEPDVCCTASALLPKVTDVRLKPGLSTAVTATHCNGPVQDTCNSGCVTELNHSASTLVPAFV